MKEKTMMCFVNACVQLRDECFLCITSSCIDDIHKTSFMDETIKMGLITNDMYI